MRYELTDRNLAHASRTCSPSCSPSIPVSPAKPRHDGLGRCRHRHELRSCIGAFVSVVARLPTTSPKPSLRSRPERSCPRPPIWVFGLDSVVEVTSAAAISWQFVAHRDHRARERTALRIVAWSFFVLAAYVAFDALHSIVSGDTPDHSPVGIVLAAASLVIMPFLSWAERLAGRESVRGAWSRTRSRPCFAPTCQRCCSPVWCSTRTMGWGWADSLAALAIAAVAVKEGRKAWQGDSCCTPRRRCARHPINATTTALATDAVPTERNAQLHVAVSAGSTLDGTQRASNVGQVGEDSRPWDRTYATRSDTELSWYERDPNHLRAVDRVVARRAVVRHRRHRKRYIVPRGPSARPRIRGSHRARHRRACARGGTSETRRRSGPCAVRASRCAHLGA